MHNHEDDTTVYKAVINDEEQYSFWPKSLPVPKGWRVTGTEGTREECGTYVKSVWTDTRPLSLRKQVDEISRTNGK